MQYHSEQFAALGQNSINSFFTLSNKAFDAAMMLGQLAAKEVKTNLEHAQIYAQRALGAKDLNDFAALHTQSTQPLLQRTTAYHQKVAEVIKSVHEDLAKSMSAKFEESRGLVSNLFDNVAQNMPAGTEAFTTAARAGLTAANHAIDNSQKVIQQAAEVLENNFSTVVKQIEKTVATNVAVPRAAKKSA